MEARVKGVVQVGGMHSLVRIDAANEARREWFNQVRFHLNLESGDPADRSQNNQIYLPKDHPILLEERTQRRLGGRVQTSGQSSSQT